MNYLRIYQEIINRARLRNTCIKGEKHHVLPQCINKQQIAQQILNCINSEDIVLVTLREHYILHLLLVYIFKNVDNNCFNKLNNAYIQMGNRTKSNSRLYELGKIRFSKYMSDKLKGKPSGAKGCKWSEQSKQKARNNSALRGKTYEQVYGKEKATPLKNKRQLFFKARNSNGISNPRASQKFYLYKNIQTGETIIARCVDMYKLYGVRLNKLTGRVKVSKNWTISSRINPPRNMMAICRQNPIFWNDLSKEMTYEI